MARALVFLVAVSLTARLSLLFARSLWFDEIFTAWAARLPLDELLSALRLDSGPPGFYVLEKPFAWLAGRFPSGDWVLRVPSFLAALALLFAAKTLPRASRLVFVSLASCSVLVTLYAVEARPYALLGLLALAAFLLALSGGETPGRLVAVAAAAAAALSCHYLAIFVVAALVVLALLGRRLRSAVALAAGAAAFLPWWPILRAQPREAIAWMQESAAGSLAGFVSALGGVGRVPSPFGGPAPRVLFLAGLAAGAVLVAVLSAVVAARRDAAVRNAFLFTLAVLAGALLVGAWRPVAFAGRTEMAVLPVWIWGVAQASPRSRAALWGSAAAALFGTAATLSVAFAPRAGDPSGVTSALSAAARPGDVIVAAAGHYLPLRFDAERGRLAASVRPLPEDAAAHPGWFVPALPGDPEARQLEREIASLPPGGRLFLVVPPAYATPALVAALETSGGRARELARGPDVLVMLRTRDRDSPRAPAGP